jgi:transcriptional regulator with XRE-family HTH domain
MKAMQSRAARSLLQWSQARLAKEAGVSTLTVRNFEAGVTKPVPATLVVIEQAFQRAGIEFIDDGGKVGVALNTKRP